MNFPIRRAEVRQQRLVELNRTVNIQSPGRMRTLKFPPSMISPPATKV